MTTLLTDLVVNEVSLVDRAAVRDPDDPSRPITFLVWKRDTGGDTMLDETTFLALETPAPGEDELNEILEKAEVQKDLANAVRMALRLLSRYKDQIPGDVFAKLAALAGYGYPSPEEKRMKRKPAQAEDEEEYGYPEVPKVRKEELPPDARAVIEKMEQTYEEIRKRAEQLEAELHAEREARLAREYVEKAEAFRYVAPPQELAPLLRAVDERLEKAEAEKLTAILKTTNERLRQSDLFREIGRQHGDGAVLSRVESKAAEIRKREPALTREQAIERALLEEPSLYAEYLAEREVR